MTSQLPKTGPTESAKAFGSAIRAHDSLGFSIVGLIFFPFSVVAIWFGKNALRNKSVLSASDRRKARLGIGIACVTLVAVVFAAMFFAAHAAFMSWTRPACASNLRQIGLSLTEYARTHDGAYPPDLATLLNEKADLTLSVFLCPATDELSAAAPSATTRIASYDLKSSYTYLYSPGLSLNTVTSDRVILIEDEQDHDYKGLNILLGDNSVEWLDAPHASHAILELLTGHNPPMPVSHQMTASP